MREERPVDVLEAVEGHVGGGEAAVRQAGLLVVQGRRLLRLGNRRREVQDVLREDPEEGHVALERPRVHRRDGPVLRRRRGLGQAVRELCEECWLDVGFVEGGVGVGAGGSGREG